MEQHPDKTFIGRISRGFDFLGYPFTPSGLAVAAKTIERFAERVARLYDQGADDLCIGAYVRRWQRWVVRGLGARKGALEECCRTWLVQGAHQQFLPARTALAPTALREGSPPWVGW